MKHVKLVALCLVVAHSAYADFGEDYERYSGYWYRLPYHSLIKQECKKYYENGSLGKDFDKQSEAGRCSRFFRALDDLYSKEFVGQAASYTRERPDVSKISLDTYDPIGESGKTVSLGRFKVKTSHSVFESINTDIVRDAVGVLHKRLGKSSFIDDMNMVIDDMNMVQRELLLAWEAALSNHGWNWSRRENPGLAFDPSDLYYDGGVVKYWYRSSKRRWRCEGPDTFWRVW